MADMAVMPIRQHLRDLKKRLSIIIIAYLLGVMVLMNFSAPVFDYFAEPLRNALPEGTPMVFLSAPDVFFTYLKVALVLSLFVTSPVTFYQFWAFVAPGLYRHERRIFLAYLLASVSLLLAGGAFAYYIVFPLIFKFFLGFATDAIQALPAVRDYLSLGLKLLFAFGLSFQIPIVIMILSRLELVDPRELAAKRRFVIVWAFILGALLTPPDVVSQLLLAFPMILLFEIGLVLAKLGKRRAEKLRRQETGEANAGGG